MVAANTSITREKDDPFDTMKHACAEPCVETELDTVAYRKGINKRKGEERVQKKKKRNGEEEEEEEEERASN